MIYEDDDYEEDEDYEESDWFGFYWINALVCLFAWLILGFLFRSPH
jgi:hypothetical protein